LKPTSDHTILNIHSHLLFLLKSFVFSQFQPAPMPEKTAEALERILSLYSAKVDAAPAAGPAEQYDGTGGPAFAGVDEQALHSSMFFEVGFSPSPSAAVGNGTLPRDCLIMLLEGALKHMPQEADAVARCMRALAPLSLEEYEQCFGSLSNTAPEFSGSAPSASPQPAVDRPDAPASNAGWEHMPPEQHQKSVMQAIDLQRPSSPDLRSSPPLGGAAQGTSSGAGEVRKTSNKAGERTSILLTDGRVGMPTSILTVEQAIEVFVQRPVQRTERAALCSVLADRYHVTTTAIRHIWDRKTWVRTNIPYWSEAEMAASLAQGTCEACRNNGVDKIEGTCEHCPINRKRGRPRGARDTYRRQRKNPQL